ncbi:Protein CBG23829 [Caenorhabditis briggsae]|uniref:Protein CBG23829 n=1 Tax=Caenorhabditis briggsae TaxID=6238 RepID=A8WJE2_CAEBR|nr:Protein CBG23829 [Caenorhabditis briggsae]CAP20584.1 Protein CBG23829 [Caenorhabditis briggsae]
MLYVDLYKCEELCNSNGRCFQKNPVQRSCDCDLGFTGRTCGVVDPNPAPISRFSPIPEKMEVFDQDPGPRTQDPGPRTQDPGPRTQDPGPRTQDPGPRTQDQGS